MSDLSVFENLALSTIRIECQLDDGNVSSGTGFYFKFHDKGDSFVPAIVTNRHVIKDAKVGHLLFTLADSNGRPVYKKHHRFLIDNFAKPWLAHPDPDVDLCVMPINVLVEEMGKNGIKPFVTFFDYSLLPTDSDIDEMIGLEKVVMVGYPNGLWDKVHNQPVFRSGVIASHFKLDWDGKPEFVIDAACVPGSSGSPVLIVDIGQVVTKKGASIGSSRVKFLGVLYAGPVLSADGTIKIVPAPTSNTFQTRTNIPINLGYVIKADKIRDFDSIIVEELRKSPV